MTPYPGIATVEPYVVGLHHIFKQVNRRADQELTVLRRQRKVVRELMCTDVLKEFGGVRLYDMETGGKGRMGSWSRLLDTDLGIKSRTQKEVLMERFITPFAEGDTARLIPLFYLVLL